MFLMSFVGNILIRFCLMVHDDNLCLLIEVFRAFIFKETTGEVY